MSDDAIDRALLGRALDEGRKGRPSPNPHVGAVIAREERVIAVGHHERAGEAHAEVDAIERAGGDTRGATLYCTLEPCNHFGRTPPCTDAILAAGIARVVIGCADPKPPRPGALDRLRAAGIEVVTGVREDEARALIADWTRHAVEGLPWALLKAAVTLDGRTATRALESRWITGEPARNEAHRLRDWSDAVLVGIGTALADDPALDVRRVEGRDPVRVVLDTHLRLPPSAKLVAHASRAPTWIVHGSSAPMERRDALARDGVELIEVATRGEHVELAAALRELARRGIVRLLVEGGPTVHGALLREGLAQEAAVFVAPKILGDTAALPLADAGALASMADAWRVLSPRIEVLGEDVLFRGRLAGPSEARGL